MSVIRQLKNPFVQQYLIEILFPLIGYYFFDWDILLIGLYYLIDYFVSIFFFLKRARLINKTSKSPIQIYKIAVVGCCLYLFFFFNLIGFVWRMSQFYANDMYGVLRKIELLFYSELWFLIPLIFMLFYFKDRMTFVVPRRFLNFDSKRYLIGDLIGAGVITFLFFTGLFLWKWFDLNDTFAILIFIGVKIIFDLTLKRKLTQYSRIAQVK